MATIMMEWEQMDYNNEIGVLIAIVVVIEC
jgi:hypothetical protein